jgi:integrase/recombinase XerD
MPDYLNSLGFTPFLGWHFTFHEAWFRQRIQYDYLKQQMKLPLRNKTFHLVLHEFTQNIRTQGYGKNSGYVTAYPACVQEFLHKVEEAGIRSLKGIKTKDVIGYFDYLLERPNKKKAGTLGHHAIDQHLLSIKLFFGFLLEFDYVETSPVIKAGFLMSKGKPRSIFTQEEIQLLYSATETLLDRCFLHLCYGCGLRRSEAHHLNISNINFSHGKINLVITKNSKPRIVPLEDGVLADLKNYFHNERYRYVRDRTPDNMEAFLLNDRGDRLSGERMNQRLKQLIDKTENAGLLRRKPDLSLHSLRTSFSVHLLDNGADVLFVQQLLDHECISTTERYTKRRKKKYELNS